MPFLIFGFNVAGKKSKTKKNAFTIVYTFAFKKI